MAIVSVAIMISFHLKHEPTPIELRVALPFGLVFWVLAFACLIAGLSNYINTVNRYSRRQALVQSGVGTQVVCLARSCLIEIDEADVGLGLHGGVLCDCCCLHFVPLYECREVVTFPSWYDDLGYALMTLSQRLRFYRTSLQISDPDSCPHHTNRANRIIPEMALKALRIRVASCRAPYFIRIISPGQSPQALA